MAKAAPAQPAGGLDASQFRAFAEMAPDAIVAGDVEDRISYVNPAAERLFGYGPGALVVGLKQRVPSAIEARTAARRPSPP